MSAEQLFLFWTCAIGVVTAVTCALCGVMLIVKREAFISEGLSHAILPGIVLAFIVVPDRSSPILILAAGASGLIMVWLVQLISKTRLVDRDAALGIVFSSLFSIGVVLASLNLRQIHFHADCIINGNLVYAANKFVVLGGYSFGPKAFVSMSVIFLVLVSFILVFYKELKLMAFDSSTARMFGLKPRLLHTVWLSLVSITAVAAFETAGTVLVVALMVAPAAAANLLTNRLSLTFVLSAVFAATGAVLGILFAHQISIAPAGPIALSSGMIFVVAAFLCMAIRYLRTRRPESAEIDKQVQPVSAQQQ